MHNSDGREDPLATTGTRTEGYRMGGDCGITNLKPSLLELSGNPITELPPEIFEIPNMQWLGIGSTLINELPRNVMNLSPLVSSIFIMDTNVSYFWPWIDPFVEMKYRYLFMNGSTYCAELEKIDSVEAHSFDVLPSPEYSKLLTDPSEENLNVVFYTVICDYVSHTFYPIELEDANNALA